MDRKFPALMDKNFRLGRESLWNENNQNRNKKGFRPNRNNDEKRGLFVEVRGDDVNKALRIFKKKVQEDGILQEYKERQAYTKPSEKRRKAKQAGRKRWLKTVEKKNLDTRAY